MRRHLALFCVAVLIPGFVIPEAKAAVFQFDSPNDVPNGTTIDFEGQLDSTIANSLYQGIRFNRDDGAGVYIKNWSAEGRAAASGANVLATIAGPTDSLWTSHVNISLAAPVHQFGVYFGNDQRLPMFPSEDFAAIRLSAYSPGGHFLGSVSLAANQNISVDQFVGIGSDIPFSDLRIENLSASGAASRFYAVVVDDIFFSRRAEPFLIPEPSSAGLLTLSALGFAAYRRKRKGP